MQIAFIVEGPFVSRGIVDWAEAKMKGMDYEEWQVRFSKTLSELEEKNDLESALREKSRKLEINISVYGSSRSVVRLDLDNIAKTIFDNITKTLFPKERGKSTPNWEDSHFWKTTVIKCIDDIRPRLEISILDFTS